MRDNRAGTGSGLETGRHPERGDRVTIYYLSASNFSDTGDVVSADETWLELAKDNGERLLVPVSAVRLVKLNATGRPTESGSTLLRPAHGGSRTDPRAGADR